MNKQEFLSALSRKLKVLKKEEIDDILQEYESIIDNKIQEGKSEEEAVLDFGDLDELAREILSAYKIDDEFVHGRNQAKDIIQEISEALASFFEQVIQFLTQFFEGMNAEGVARLIVMIAVGFILLFFMRIPFYIIEGIGSAMLSLILPNFLEHLFIWFWSLFCNLAYFVFAIYFLRDIIKKKGIKIHKTVNIKDKKVEVHVDQSMSEDHIEVKVGNDTQDKSFEYDSGELLRNDFSDVEVEYEYEDDEQDDIEQPTSTSSSSGWLIRLFTLFFKGVLALFLLPIWVLIIILCVFLGLLFYLAFTGSAVWGFALLLAGMVGILGAVSDFFWNMVATKKKHTIWINFIISAIFIGFGSILTVNEMSQFTIVQVPVNTLGFTTITQSQTFHLNSATEFTYNVNHEEIVIDETLADNAFEIRVETLASSHASLNLVERENGINQLRLIWADENNFSFSDFQHLIQIGFEGLRENVLYSFDGNLVSIEIRVNANTYDKIERSSDGYIIFDPNR